MFTIVIYGNFSKVKRKDMSYVFQKDNYYLFSFIIKLYILCALLY